MLATYIIQAILITVYVCGILTVNLNQRPNQSWMWPPLSRILSAVLDTTREFLSTSAMFSLALLIASICSITQDEAYSTSTTTWILLLVIPLYSVLAVSVLHLAASEILQRYKGRVLVLLIIDVMVIVLAARSSFAYNYVGYGLNWKDFDPWTYGSPCLKLTSFKKMAVVSWTVAGFLCLGITTYLIDFLISMIRKRPGILAQPSGMVRWGIIGVGLCAMWFLIGWFVKLTLDIRSRSGDNNEDNQWTFGQVLALSTWWVSDVQIPLDLCTDLYPSVGHLSWSNSVIIYGKDQRRRMKCTRIIHPNRFYRIHLQCNHQGKMKKEADLRCSSEY